MADEEGKKVTRREFLKDGARGAAVLALGCGAGLAATRGSAEDRVWQIDPYKCIHCGNCATYCVLTPSAVKCFHAIDTLCGYCKVCYGYYQFDPVNKTTGAESLLCPVDAITRKKVTDTYYEYTIDEDKCIGCGRCAKGCHQGGAKSLYLQVRQDLCLNCGQCSIAEACPTDAFVRVPASDPYIIKPRRSAT